MTLAVDEGVTFPWTLLTLTVAAPPLGERIDVGLLPLIFLPAKLLPAALPAWLGPRTLVTTVLLLLFIALITIFLPEGIVTADDLSEFQFKRTIFGWGLSTLLLRDLAPTFSNFWDVSVSELIALAPELEKEAPGGCNNDTAPPLLISKGPFEKQSGELNDPLNDVRSFSNTDDLPSLPHITSETKLSFDDESILSLCTTGCIAAVGFSGLDVEDADDDDGFEPSEFFCDRLCARWRAILVCRHTTDDNHLREK